MDLTFDELDTRIEIAVHSGPEHCVICASGRAVSAAVAHQRYAVKPEVIFVRADGWTLGAPLRFRQVAERTWRSLWVAEIAVATGEVKEYRYRTS